MRNFISFDGKSKMGHRQIAVFIGQEPKFNFIYTTCDMRDL